MRWFISYQKINNNFLLPKGKQITYHSLIIDVTPAEWLRKYSLNYNIIYVEQISLALASELIHGGAGIPVTYLREDE